MDIYTNDMSTGDGSPNHYFYWYTLSILSTYLKYSDILKFFISAMKFKITKFDCLNIY